MAITHKTVLITPKLAAEMLEKNTGNFRKPIPASIRKYGIALREGKWQFNGETIKIAIDGTVLDGQNRLYAIVETGISMPCIVVYGLPPERAMTMDTGKPRAIQDWIRHAGIKNANAVTAIGRSAQHRENAYMQRMLACVAWNKTVRGETINKLLKFSMTGPNASRPIEVIELAPSNS